MSKIKAVTNDRKLIITSRPPITSGSRNVDELAVVFDKSWAFDSASYYVNFYIDDDSDGVVRRFNISGSVGKCTIPDYITEKEGFFHFGVFAKADNDIVKTSDVAGYKIERGICTAPDGDEHETWHELKKRIIDLLNANLHGVSLSYSARFEDIDATVTTFMSGMYSSENSYRECSDGLYNLVKENINPYMEKEDDITMAFLSNFVELENYFATHVPKIELDSAEEMIIDLQDDNQAIINSMYALYTGGVNNV